MVQPAFSYAESTYSPTDASGAGLTFTINNAATVTRVGRFCFVRIDITFPVTANVSAAVVTVPFPQSANYAGFGSGVIGGGGAGIVTYSDTSGMKLNNASTGIDYTNANLSGKRIICSISYTV